MEKAIEVETTRYASLSTYTKIFFLALTIFGIAIAVFYLFSFRVGDFYLYEIAYYYLFVGAFLACGFLVMPARKKDKGVPYYDYLAAALSFGIAIYFFLNGWEIGQMVHQLCISTLMDKIEVNHGFHPDSSACLAGVRPCLRVSLG